MSKRAEQLAKELFSGSGTIKEIRDGLLKYGTEVRKRDAEVCKLYAQKCRVLANEQKDRDHALAAAGSEGCAAAIDREELP